MWKWPCPGLIFVVLTYLYRWNTYVVEGHDVEELCKAFWQAQQVKDKPTCIVAQTFKGKGLKSTCVQMNSDIHFHNC